MADLDISDYESFDFISPPGRQAIASAVQTLKHLDAIGDDLKLSKIGRMMTEFPLLPRHARYWLKEYSPARMFWMSFL